jgi:hypothetical protein
MLQSDHSGGQTESVQAGYGTSVQEEHFPTPMPPHPSMPASGISTIITHAVPLVVDLPTTHPHHTTATDHADQADPADPADPREGSGS